MAVETALTPVALGHAAEIERLHAISVEIASLQELSRVMDRALDYCLELTASQFGFVGLMLRPDQMDVAAIKGFTPRDPQFYHRFRTIPVRMSVFGVVVLTGRSYLSNDVLADPLHVGRPGGHPPVRTFLGVPLLFAGEVLGMIGVANREGGYGYERERLLDEERRRIARELHDRVEQTFFSIGLTANAALDGASVGAAEPLRAALASIRGLAAQGAEQMREAIFALSRAEVHDRGLVQALWKLVRAFQHRTGIDADLVLAGDERRLRPEAAEALYAVAREALANVEQHAQASAAVVSLRFGPRSATLAVQDDGVGAPNLVLRSLTDSVTHFGLQGLNERVRQLGGTFTVRPGDDGGLVVRARIPLHP